MPRCAILNRVAELSPVNGFHAVSAIVPCLVSYAANVPSLLLSTVVTAAGSDKRGSVMLMNRMKMILILVAGFFGTASSIFAGIAATALG